MTDLVEKMRKGDRRSLSRLLSYVEKRDQRAFGLLEETWPFTGKAFTLGVTGPAGAGKSTLIDQLISLLREKGKKVGVIAVDPTSPFSGGAVLGDRLRMQRHYNDPDVFIRSVATQGRSGGVSFATRALIQVLDAFGVDIIIVETAGAGQSEVDIKDLVQTTVVTLVPEAGDSIQAMKAGILEIADVFVVNKKDRSGADQMAAHLEATLSLIPNPDKWRPPIVMTEAQSGDGVAELWKAIESHRADVSKTGVAADEKLRRNLHSLLEIIDARLNAQVLEKAESNSKLVAKLKAEKKPNLYAVAEDFLRDFRWDQEAKRPSAKRGQ